MPQQQAPTQKPKTSTRWVWGVIGLVTVVAGVFAWQFALHNDEQRSGRTVGAMLTDQPHPFDDDATAGSSFAATPNGEISAEIYTNRLSELASALGLPMELATSSDRPDITITVNNENRAAMRIVLENILNQAVERSEISYVDRDRVLYTFDLGLIDAPTSAIAEHAIGGAESDAQAPDTSAMPKQPTTQ
ncbi:hypothetical protein [Corynebacterium pseudodiphtheriticum]|uniref:hypothetical protein n=1 Tax=Corynebacterium pseudodiphtheriticum TaxID=37637 RepID=UPI0020C05287|nr:hypothetical protein [Corynebacterium pseudodiphtheriticum]MDK8499750.1 hypothetical protein [Corynebacterium pseudodiphtheriticum]MDK8545159.1 hypothetical protein [Corynebacterium pseudodiphtheriticum]MDK8562247.1 hypothetical protein [Corynebacterium pseudodiphtheriticum]MDK8578026.1 hypothetical protein [Corynebacterium pseudodiphtheriticum]MDK8583216.1 hypothetical protein [Corynebacterium pseudodiphtheriticum]